MSGYENYVNAPSIGRIGMAFYETENKPELLDAYFSQALGHIADLRQRCSPYTSPIDRVRCELDEVWPSGAHLESLYGKKMFVGLSRVVNANVRMLAHHDIFSKDASDNFHANSLLAQFACNVYLSVPEDGGELEIWNQEISPAEFDRMRGESYGIQPEELGLPLLKIKPNKIKPNCGDLILFNSTKMHAVTKSNKSSRLSVSFFIGYRGDHVPLTFWS